MKNILLLIAILAVGFANAQSQEVAPGDSIPWELRKQSFIYNAASMFNDPVILRTAIYSLLAENPGNISLYDSLAMSYLQYDQYASAVLVAQQSLQMNPENQFAIEIAAAGFDNLGIKDKALLNYEKLYLANEQLNVLYKMAFLQMELARYAEADNSLDIIIKAPQSEENSVGFSTVDGKGQNITLKVAAHRIKAMVLEEKGEVKKAQEKYLEVLEMHPGFQIVQQQLRKLTTPKTEE